MSTHFKAYEYVFVVISIYFMFEILYTANLKNVFYM